MPWSQQSAIFINPGEMSLVSTLTIPNQLFNFQFGGFDENDVRLFGVAMHRLQEAAPAGAILSTRASVVIWNAGYSWASPVATAVGGIWMYVPENAGSPRAVTTFRFVP